jgi:uncharacterized Fe-S cluster-containing radical SAM superfamily enzyme
MAFQWIKSISYEFSKLATCNYSDETIVGIIKDEKSHQVQIEKITNNYTTHDEKLDEFIFKDMDNNIIGHIKCKTSKSHKEYSIEKELPYEYIGQIDSMAFLLMHIYYNPCWTDRFGKE